MPVRATVETAVDPGQGLGGEGGGDVGRVRQDGEDIVFYVPEHGVVMGPGQVRTILQRDPTDRTGIGIKNVNDRLQIYFGKRYGLRITSELDVGTCVELRMPTVQEGAYEAK